MPLKHVLSRLKNSEPKLNEMYENALITTEAYSNAFKNILKVPYDEMY